MDYETIIPQQATAEQIRIAALESDLQAMQLKKNKAFDELQALRDNLQHWTKEQLGQGTINNSQATELAELGNFELTRSYDVTLVVDHSFSIEIPIDEDIDDVLNDLSFSIDQYSYEIDNEDSNVTDVNYSEQDF